MFVPEVFASAPALDAFADRLILLLGAVQAGRGGLFAHQSIVDPVVLQGHSLVLYLFYLGVGRLDVLVYLV